MGQIPSQRRAVFQELLESQNKAWRAAVKPARQALRIESDEVVSIEFAESQRFGDDTDCESLAPTLRYSTRLLRRKHLLADRLGHAMLLRKGELYRLVDFVDPKAIPEEVSDQLDVLAAFFAEAKPGEEA
jgi:hypothetical protein